MYSLEVYCRDISFIHICVPPCAVSFPVLYCQMQTFRALTWIVEAILCLILTSDVAGNQWFEAFTVRWWRMNAKNYFHLYKVFIDWDDSVSSDRRLVMKIIGSEGRMLDAEKNSQSMCESWWKTQRLVKKCSVNDTLFYRSWDVKKDYYSSGLNLGHFWGTKREQPCYPTLLQVPLTFPYILYYD